MRVYRIHNTLGSLLKIDCQPKLLKRNKIVKTVLANFRVCLKAQIQIYLHLQNYISRNQYLIIRNIWVIIIMEIYLS